MHDSLAAKGQPTALVTFDDESHGFKKHQNIGKCGVCVWSMYPDMIISFLNHHHINCLTYIFPSTTPCRAVPTI